MNFKRFENNPAILVIVLNMRYGISENQIAELFEVEVQTVRRWMKGESKPDQEIIDTLKLAYILVKLTRPVLIIIKFIRKKLVALLKNLIQNIVKKKVRNAVKNNQNVLLDGSKSPEDKK